MRSKKKKNFSKNPDKIFRHIASELGELDAAMYEFEKLEIEERKDPEGLLNFKNIREFRCKKVGEELLDLIFLCSYMAELYGVDLNEIAPARMESIRREYRVAWPEKKCRE
jgi:NTP pyrophosphatase (non-canonical NTP hydrolase)